MIEQQNYISDVPAMNSLDSIYMCSEKPIVYGKLKEIQKKLGGFDAFPLIPQIYYPNIRTCDWFEENEKVILFNNFLSDIHLL